MGETDQPDAGDTSGATAAAGATRGAAATAPSTAATRGSAATAASTADAIRPAAERLDAMRVLPPGGAARAAVRDIGSVRLQPDLSIKIPHVGWNSLDITRADSIVDGVPTGSQVYFTHSYVAPITADTVAVTEHGEPFASIVQRGHVAGVQFHPEKSGQIGLQILRNFLAMTHAR